MKYLRRWLSNILFSFLFCSSAFSQTDELQDYYYQFVNYKNNQVTDYGNGSLNHFFKQLDTLVSYNANKVNIVHIGDSHIQADFFSNRTRERFHTEPFFGNGGRGFLFPYTLAQTNNPPFYGVRYNGKWEGARNSVNGDDGHWGLSGVIATTKDSNAKFTVKLNNFKDNKATYDCEWIRVYYEWTKPESYQVRVEINDSLCEPVSYDSAGFVTFELDKALEEVDFEIKKTDSLQTSFEIQGLYFGTNDPGIVYHSIGVNGAKVDSYLRCPLLEQHLKTLDADLVIVSLGTNDAYPSVFSPDHYKIVYRRLLQKIKAAAPNASLLLTSPGDGMRRRWYINKNNEKATKALFEIAKENNCAVWDFYDVMGGLKSMHQWVHFGLGKRDYLHLTVNGYRLQGELLYRALIENTYFGAGQNVFKNNWDFQE